MSSAGKKTPDELNMRDQNVITVHHTKKASQEMSVSSSRKTYVMTSKKAKGSKQSSMRPRGKCKKKIQKQEEQVKTLEEYKA